MSNYSFGGNPINADQFNSLRSIAMLGQAGLISPQSGMSMIAQNLMPKTNQSNDISQILSSFNGNNRIVDNPFTASFGKAPQQPSPTSQQMPGTQEQGSFGFGIAPGQLFGQGGLIANLTQPFRQGLVDPAISGMQSQLQTFGNILRGQPLTSVDNSEQIRQATEGLAQKFKMGQITKDKLQEGLNQLKGMIPQNSAMGNPNAAIENQSGATGLPSILGGVSQQEHNDYMSNPALGGLKSGAGILSYGVPVGEAATIPGAIARGAGAGALFGFGTSRPGLDEAIKNTVLGGMTGGLTAGALKAVLPWLGQIGESLKNNIIGAEPNAAEGIMSQNAAKEINSATSGLLKEAKLPMGTAGEASNSIETLMNNKAKELTPFLENSNKALNNSGGADLVDALKGSPGLPADLNIVKSIAQANPDSVLGKFINATGDSNSILNNTTVQEQLAKFAGLGENASPSDVGKFIFGGKNADGVFVPGLDQKIKYSANGESGSSAAQEGLRMLRDIVSTDLKTQVPEAAKVLGDLATLHQGQTSVLDKLGNNLNARGRIPGVPMSLPMNISGVVDRVGSGIGNVLSGTNNKLAQEGLTRALTSAGTTMSNNNANPSSSSNLNLDPNIPQYLDKGQYDINNQPGMDKATQLAKTLTDAGYTKSNIQSQFKLNNIPDPWAKVSTTQKTLIDRKIDAYKQLGDLLTVVNNNSGQFGTIAGGGLGDLANSIEKGKRDNIRKALTNASMAAKSVIKVPDINDSLNMYQDTGTLTNNIQQLQARIRQSLDDQINANSGGTSMGGVSIQ